MWLISFLITWTLAPLAELAVIIRLCIANGSYKRKIRELTAKLEEGEKQSINLCLTERAEVGLNQPEAEEKKAEEKKAEEKKAEEKKAEEKKAEEKKAEEKRAEEKKTEQKEAEQKETEQKEAIEWHVISTASPGTMVQRQRRQENNREAIAALLAGVVFVVLAGLVFATTARDLLTAPCKACLVLALSGGFFGISFLAERKLHIHKTGNAFYVLGSIFLFLFVLTAAYFRLLGPSYILVGQNRWRVLWVGSLPTVGMLFLGIKRFNDRIYTQACFWGVTVSVTFLLLGYNTSGVPGFLSGMMVYGFLMVLGNFPSIHFWIAALPVMIWGLAAGCFWATHWLNWQGFLSLAAMTAGAGICAWRDGDSKLDWKKAFFNLAIFETIHYLAMWIFVGLSESLRIPEGLPVFLAEVLTVLWIWGGRKKKLWIFNDMGLGIGMACVFWDAWLLQMQAIIGTGNTGTELLGALAGAGVLAAVLMIVGKRQAWARSAGLFVLWYMVFFPLKAWVFYEMGYSLAQNGERLMSDWIHRGILEFVMLGGAALWERKKRPGWNISLLILGTLSQIIYFPGEKITFPFFLLLSGYLFLEAMSAGKGEAEEEGKKSSPVRRGRALYKASAAYAMAGVYLFMLPFTEENGILRMMAVIWVYVLYHTAERKISAWNGENGESDAYWDIWGCALMTATLWIYYNEPGMGTGSLLLCLAAFVGFYRMFYLGKSMWPHLIISVVFLPMPFVLASRYSWTQDQWYGIVAFTSLVTGIVSRCFGRICKRDEKVWGGWRVDWYHVIDLLWLVPMAAFNENGWWRFACWILAGLYFAQYGAEKQWRKWAWPAAALMGVFAFWCQPFVEIPQLIKLEVNLLWVALYLGSLRYVWKEKDVARQTVQEVGYRMCLLVLWGDAWLKPDVANALILEGICLGIFLWALIKERKQWVRMPGIILVTVALYMTKGFWLSISWWVYLLTAGIGLIGFAAFREKRKR